MSSLSSEKAEKYAALARKQSEFRGRILSAYAQAEFLLLHIALQSRILKEYWRLELRYHRKLEYRVKQARALFAAEGPLNQYNSRVTALLDELEPYKEDRDFFAHAFCQAKIVDGETTFIYKMLRQDESKTHLVERAFRLNDLEELEFKLTSLAQRYVVLFKEIYLAEDLEKYGTFTG